MALISLCICSISTGHRPAECEGKANTTLVLLDFKYREHLNMCDSNHGFPEDGPSPMDGRRTEQLFAPSGFLVSMEQGSRCIASALFGLPVNVTALNGKCRIEVTCMFAGGLGRTWRYHPSNQATEVGYQESSHPLPTGLAFLMPGRECSRSSSVATPILELTPGLSIQSILFLKPVILSSTMHVVVASDWPV